MSGRPTIKLAGPLRRQLGEHVGDRTLPHVDCGQNAAGSRNPTPSYVVRQV